jgi:hypothetical protein
VQVRFLFRAIFRRKIDSENEPPAWLVSGVEVKRPCAANWLSGRRRTKVRIARKDSCVRSRSEAALCREPAFWTTTHESAHRQKGFLFRLNKIRKNSSESEPKVWLASESRSEAALCREPAFWTTTHESAHRHKGFLFC